jgi:hypothetical protein
VLAAGIVTVANGLAEADEQSAMTPVLRENPIVEKLLKDADQDTIVELERYIGQAQGDTIRLYRSLSLYEYLPQCAEAIS